jgi:hypothetical protein
LEEKVTPAELEATKELEQVIEKSLEEDIHSEPLFHYTDAHGFSEIVKTGEIWATHFRFLNDAKELHHGEALIMEEAARLQQAAATEIQKEFYKLFLDSFPFFKLSARIHVFIASFSEQGDQLSQWRAYGGGGSGYAIGFQKLPRGSTGNDETAPFALSLFRCNYDEVAFRELVSDRIQRAAQALERLAPRFVQEAARSLALGTAMAALFRVLSYETPRLKHSGFSEEKEWRLVAITAPPDGENGLTWPEDVGFRARNGGLVPFLKLSCCVEPGPARLGLARVVVGPAEDPERATLAARMLLEKYGYDPDIVSLSGVPFRSR